MQKGTRIIVVCAIVSATFIALWYCTSASGKNLLRESWNEVWGTGGTSEVTTRVALNSAASSSESQNSGIKSFIAAPVIKKSSPKTVAVPESTASSDESSSLEESSTNEAASGTAITISGDDNAAGSSSQTISLPAPQVCSVLDGIAEAPSREVLLNEIAWMGSPAATGETSSHASEREWIELKNDSASDVSLAGWQLLDAAGNIKINFSADDSIAANSFYLLARSSSTFSAAAADKIYSGSLSNNGDRLVLFDPQCAPSDIVDAANGWPAGNSATKQTMERDEDGNGWHTSSATGGTPDAENSAAAPTMYALSVALDGAASSVVSSTPVGIDCGMECNASYASGTAVNLTETPGPGATFNGWSGACFGLGTCSFTVNGTTTVTADFTSSPTPMVSELSPAAASDISSSGTPPSGHAVIMAVQIGGASSSNDFVKIMNPTATAIDVSGWKLHKRSSSGTDYSLKTFPDAIIAPGTMFVWANSENGFSESIGAQVSSTETLAADNSVALFDATGAVVDEVAWGTGTDQYVEGAAFPTDPAPGQVLTRNVANGAAVDTDNNANDFTLQ